MTDIDFTDPRSVRAEAERRQKLRAAGVVTFSGEDEPEAKASDRPQPEFPIRITLPWSVLISDNKRVRPIATNAGPGERPHPRMALTPEYKAAAASIRGLAKRAMGEAMPADGELAIVARVYRPSGRRCDVMNFAKGVHDALQGIVYRDDLQLQDARWLRAGTDTDAPRAEIEIRPL